MTAKTSLEIYHVGNAHRKMAMWAAQSHEESWVPSKPSACYQDPAMQGPRARPSCGATWSPLRLFMLHGRKHIHDTRPGGQHRNRGPPSPITGHIFYTDLLVGDRGHCGHSPVHPTQSQALTTPTSNPIHGCSHFSPSVPLCQAGLNHTGSSLPPGALLPSSPKTLLFQPWPVD